MSRMLFAAAVAVMVAGPAWAQDFDPMQFADGDRDGKVTQDEFSVFQATGWQYVMQDAAQVKPADVQGPGQMLIDGLTPDANGMVTKEAFMAAVPARFKAADTNTDGTLDAAELGATMKMPN